MIQALIDDCIYITSSFFYINTLSFVLKELWCRNITYSGDGTGVETPVDSGILGAVVAVAFSDILLFPILRKIPTLSSMFKSYTIKYFIVTS